MSFIDRVVSLVSQRVRFIDRVVSLVSQRVWFIDRVVSLVSQRMINLSTGARAAQQNLKLFNNYIKNRSLTF